MGIARPLYLGEKNETLDPEPKMALWKKLKKYFRNKKNDQKRLKGGIENARCRVV